jgi:hypothetical protein
MVICRIGNFFTASEARRTKGPRHGTETKSRRRLQHVGSSLACLSLRLRLGCAQETPLPGPLVCPLFIFLARLQAEQEDGDATPPAGGVASARARSLPSGTVFTCSSGSRSRSCLVSVTRTVDRAAPKASSYVQE